MTQKSISENLLISKIQAFLNHEVTTGYVYVILFFAAFESHDQQIINWKNL